MCARSHEQVIDSVNIDTVLFAGYDTDKQANADRILKTFHAFIEENKDEILALRIIYDQRYKDRPMAITKLKALYEKLKAQSITIGAPVGMLCHQEAGKGTARHRGTAYGPDLHHPL